MSQEMSRGRGEKILVVDDTTANLRLLTNLLTEHGYEVHPACEGELALGFVRLTPPDLILLDIRMEGMDGFEVCRRLKADERTRGIPVIFISILENQGDKVTGLRVGAVDYITKPFQPEEVLARVRIHLRLRELTEHLERTVDARTRELRQATERLELELAERKRAEVELRASEEQLRLTMERYRLVFENSPVSIWEEDLSEIRTAFDRLRKGGVTDLEAHFEQHPETVRRLAEAVRVLDLNRAALALHGAAAKPELLGGLVSTFTAESFEAFRQELICLWNGGTAMTADAVVRTLRGERRNVTVNFRVCPGYETSLSKVLVSLSDITERKRTEESLALRSFALNNVHEAAYLIDEQGRFHYVNEESCRVLGYSYEELLRMGLPDIDPDLPADLGTGTWASRWADLKAHRSRTLEGRHRTKHGRVFPVEISANYLEYEGKGYNLSLVRDISERKRAEEAQRRLTRELRAIGRCNQTLLRATDEQFLIAEICRIVCEEAGYRMAWVGYAEHDAFKSVRPVAWAGAEDGYLATANISWSEDSENGRGPTGTAVRSGKSGYFQDFATDPLAVPWRDKALQRGYHSAIAFPLQDEHANSFGAITIYSTEPNAFTAEEIRLLGGLAADLAFGIVTLRTRSERERGEQERSKLRQHLQQVQKLEVVGQLAGGIAHDFNNVLGVVNGYSAALLENPSIDEAARVQVREILSAGNRAASLTRQLLAFSRRQLLQRKVLNLNRVIRSMKEMLGRLIGEHIEIRFAIDAGLDPVMADPSQMEQVVLNLCVNARDAMPEGGTITIEAVNVELDEVQAAQHLPLEPGRYVRLAVRDTGIGMTAETLSHIFEPFFTTKAPDRGTGLGLATVYGIVTQTGGQIFAESEPGKGSAFFVYLPAAIGQSETREREKPPLGSVRGTETILLVEDVAALRTLARQVLEKCGYRVLEAEDGERALQIAQESAADISLLVTDVVLPKIKGTFLAENLRNLKPGIKVLLVSGFSDHEVVCAAAPGTATAFLQKPFSPGELTTKVRELLDTT